MGGTIAVLKPINIPESSPLKREVLLRLADDSHAGRTMATIDGLELDGGVGQVLIQYVDWPL